ncbi:hypothetical protein RB595_002920 [Gaeumannomyces hyphopodioides]
MGCGGRKQHLEVRPEQKWDYISLTDFKSTSCWAPFAYGYLYVSLLISMAVYSVDSFTAVNLLAFDKWPSELQPAVGLEVSKWIFSVCIILSFLNLAYEHIRAQRVMSRGSVAESYLDNLAVRLESIRVGKGKGWRRFLVFAELTKSKKGAEYAALFTYFSFQSWFRVIVCSGPRQAVNAMTLWKVYNSKLSAQIGPDVGRSILSFFQKIKILAETETRLALILSGMLFTLVIWVISMLALIAAVLIFIFFLWAYVPSEDGSLSAYCSRKINKRLMAIVSEKVNKGIAEEERRRKKAEFKAAKKAGERPPEELKATLPDIGDDKLPAMPVLSRSDTMATLPAYSSRPGTPGDYELSQFSEKTRMPPSRTATMSSSVSSRAPLIGTAAEFGRSASPAPTLPNMDLNNYPPVRPGTASSMRGYGAPPPGRMGPNGALGGGYTASPVPYSSETVPQLPRPTMSSPRMAPQGYHRSQASGGSVGGFSQYNSNGRASPAPSMPSQRGPTPGPMSQGSSYPQRSATNPMPPRGPQYPQPQRNMTAPPRQHTPANDYYNSRSPGPGNQGTPPPRGGYGNGNGWNSDLESQGGRGPRY